MEDMGDLKTLKLMQIFSKTKNLLNSEPSIRLTHKTT